jgi:hypothetical protein
MLVQASLGLACLLQLCGTAAALPLKQTPLRLNAYKGVQAVRAK